MSKLKKPIFRLGDGGRSKGHKEDLELGVGLWEEKNHRGVFAHGPKLAGAIPSHPKPISCFSQSLAYQSQCNNDSFLFPFALMLCLLKDKMAQLPVYLLYENIQVLDFRTACVFAVLLGILHSGLFQAVGELVLPVLPPFFITNPPLSHQSVQNLLNPLFSRVQVLNHLRYLSSYLREKESCFHSFPYELH